MKNWAESLRELDEFSPAWFAVRDCFAREDPDRYRRWLDEEWHSDRFRTVSNRYPRRVAEAYGGDIERAAADSDEQVAAIVASWERAHGFDPVNWQAIGAEERGDDEP